MTAWRAMTTWRVIAAAEPAVLLAITPLLLFPLLRPIWTAAGLALLAVVWVLRAFVRRETWPVTPANLALLLFCLTIPPGVWASAALDLTLPKLTSLILGLAAFRAITLSARTPQGRLLSLAVFALAGLAIWSLGLLGSGFSFMQPLARRMPRALMDVIQGSDQAVNPNVLAGGLVAYLPIAVVCAAYCWQTGRKALAFLSAFIGLLIFATLLRAQARSAVAAAITGAVLVVFLFAWFKTGRRGKGVLALSVAAVILVALVAGVVLLSDPSVQAAVLAGEGEVLNKGLSLASRIEIWSRALYALQDFPFTGVGLGTFGRVLPLLYPLFLTPPDVGIPHAHNVFLQVGVDLGLGGLIAYIALVLTSAATAWQAAEWQHGFTRYLALGLLASLLSVQVHGMTNNVLDARPAIVFWMLLGLIASLSQSENTESRSVR